MLAVLLYLNVLALGEPLSAERAVQERFERLESLPLERIQALAPEIVRLGPEAAAPLARIASDKKRSFKARLWALTFTGMLGDPAAFPALRDAALNEDFPNELRLSGLAALPGQKVSAQAHRIALTELLRKKAAPSLEREALSQAARVGLDDPKVAERAARRFGRGEHPIGKLALAALGRSEGEPAARALLELAAFYPPASEMRRLCLAELRRQDVGLAAVAEPGAEALRKIAGEEARFKTGSTLAAVDLLAAMKDERSASLFTRFLSEGDPELVAAAAEGLAEIRGKDALPRLTRLFAELHADPRFGPESVPAARRIERALKALQASENK